MNFVLRKWRISDAADVARFADNEKIAANLRNVRSAGRLRLTDRLPGAWVSSAGQMSMRGAPNWVTGWLRNTGKRGL